MTRNSKPSGRTISLLQSQQAALKTHEEATAKEIDDAEQKLREDDERHRAIRAGLMNGKKDQDQVRDQHLW